MVNNNLTFLILIFFKTKIINIFVKKKIKQKKKENVIFLKNKNITTDYFSSHAYNFYEVLKKFNKFTFWRDGRAV